MMTKCKDKGEETCKLLYLKLWNISDKNIKIACLYYLWLSVARIDIIYIHVSYGNVIFFPFIYTTIPPVTNDFFTKYMYYDEIKFINVSFSSLLTNLCEKIDFDSWPPEGPFSPDGSHITYLVTSTTIGYGLLAWMQRSGPRWKEARMTSRWNEGQFISSYFSSILNKLSRTSETDYKSVQKPECDWRLSGSRGVKVHTQTPGISSTQFPSVNNRAQGYMSWLSCVVFI